MNAAPILVLQMQRMGDLVLSFPLLGRLSALFPGHPLWVVGEKNFFEPLLALSPQAVYFGYDAAPGLLRQNFYLVINLSHRPEAAQLAGRLKSDAHLGPVADAEGRLFVRGDWQLYRTSLTDNNRYNLFHWADLNCLDLCRPELMLRTVWPPVLPPDRIRPAGSGARLGLFLGASQPEKHPDANFWAALCAALLRAGHKPVLLGGKAEKALGNEVARRLGIPALNLCGRFSVSELAAFLGRLDLLITPDTGPMHVAAWIGTACLNLSLGPVNAWETGPFAPGHHVLRAALDCVGCWNCTKERQFCRQALGPKAVAEVAQSLLAGEGRFGNPPAAEVPSKGAPPDGPPPRKTLPDNGLSRPLTGRTHDRPGPELFRTRRDALGLFDLEPLIAPSRPEREERLLLSRFWQSWFATRFAYAPQKQFQNAARALAGAFPENADRLRAAAAAFALDLGKEARAGRFYLTEDPGAWRTADPLFLPFSGYAQMYAKNESGSAASRKTLLLAAEELAALPLE